MRIGRAPVVDWNLILSVSILERGTPERRFLRQAAKTRTSSIRRP